MDNAKPIITDKVRDEMKRLEILGNVLIKESNKSIRPVPLYQIEYVVSILKAVNKKSTLNAITEAIKYDLEEDWLFSQEDFSINICNGKPVKFEIVTRKHGISIEIWYDKEGNITEVYCGSQIKILGDALFFIKHMNSDIVGRLPDVNEFTSKQYSKSGLKLKGSFDHIY